MGPYLLGCPAGPPFTTPDRLSEPPTEPEGGEEETVEEWEERSQSCCSASSGVILAEGSHLQRQSTDECCILHIR